MLIVLGIGLILLLGLCATVVNICYTYKPKQKLTQAAYDSKMRSIESLRLEAIEAAKSDEDIDGISCRVCLDLLRGTVQPTQ